MAYAYLRGQAFACVERDLAWWDTDHGRALWKRVEAMIRKYGDPADLTTWRGQEIVAIAA